MANGDKADKGSQSACGHSNKTKCKESKVNAFDGLETEIGPKPFVRGVLHA